MAETGCPTVVNRHHYSSRQEIPKPWIYIGRGTPLGNPYTVEEHGEAALEMYKKHLWRRMKARDPAVLRTLNSISEHTTLVCSCKPRPCHGDVVVQAWQWMRQQQRKTHR